MKKRAPHFLDVIALPGNSEVTSGEGVTLIRALKTSVFKTSKNILLVTLIVVSCEPSNFIVKHNIQYGETFVVWRFPRRPTGARLIVNATRADRERNAR